MSEKAGNDRGWRKFHDAELHHFYSSTNKSRAVKSTRQD
jgi:hypothetical protein